MMNDKIATPITDKNGKNTTVHKNPAKTVTVRAAKAPAPAKKIVDPIAEASEYYGGVPFTKKGTDSVRIDYRSLGDVVSKINGDRNVFLGDRQIKDIGQNYFGPDFDYDTADFYKTGGEVNTDMNSYQKFLYAISITDPNPALYTADEAYAAARNNYFYPAADEGYTPSSDDSFEHGWQKALEFMLTTVQKFHYEIPAPSRGRKDISWDDKFITAAEMDAGRHVYQNLGIKTLAATGDTRLDWHEITGAGLVRTIGSILDDNRHSVRDSKISGILKEFLGNEWSADYSALEFDNRTKYLVNVQDLKEALAEIAVANR